MTTHTSCPTMNITGGILMASVSTILSDIATLSSFDKSVLKIYLVELFAAHNVSLENFIKDERFF